MRHILFAASALLLSATTLAADDEKFIIRHAEPALGSHIRGASLILDVPPNKSYAELSEHQKRKVKAHFQPMAPSDEPPYPVGGVGELYKVLSFVQEYWKARGEFEMVATVKADGKVSLVSVYKTPDHKMTEYMAQILAVQQFKPALCEGVPCEMDYPLRLSMTRKKDNVPGFAY